MLAANYKLNTKSNYKLDATPRDRPDAGEKGRKMFTRTTDIQPGVLQIIKVKNADLGNSAD